LQKTRLGKVNKRPSKLIIAVVEMVDCPAVVAVA
jgi:hypothetical protein